VDVVGAGAADDDLAWVVRGGWVVGEDALLVVRGVVDVLDALELASAGVLALAVLV
jgi:hypothetical protein